MPKRGAVKLNVALPVEIWREIIVLATAVDGEFDPLAWEEANDPWQTHHFEGGTILDSSQNPYIDDTNQQLSISIPIRASFRLVSKTCKSIIDEIFFSSLHLRSHYEMLLALEIMQKSLQEEGDHGVGRWVKRITFGPSKFAKFEDSEGTMRRIIELCPNLLLIVDKGPPPGPGQFPFPFFHPLLACRKLQYIFSQSYLSHDLSTTASFLSSMVSIRFMVLTHGPKAHDDFKKLSFPHLHTLDLTVCPTRTLDVAATWDLPSLQRLLCHYREIAQCKGLHLIAGGLTDLTIHGSPRDSHRNPFHELRFRRLRRLYWRIDSAGRGSEMIPLQHLLTSPSLETVVLSLVNHDDVSRQLLKSYVDAALGEDASTTLERIVFLLGRVSQKDSIRLSRFARELTPKNGNLVIVSVF